MDERETHNLPDDADRRRFFPVPPDEDLSYPVMASGAMSIFDDDRDTVDETILDGLVHP